MWMRESFSGKGNFSMFRTYLSPIELQAKMTFFSVVNLNKKTATQVINVVNQFFPAKSIKLDKILSSVLDGSNAMSGEKNGLQRRVSNFSSFNIYISYCNHRPAVCWPQLMKNTKYAVLLLDCDAVVFAVWQIIHYSPENGAIWNQFQTFTVKSLLKC